MELEKEYLLRKKQGPTYVGGDFNARLHQALGIGENNVMGTHFFDKGNEQTHLMTDPIWCNRSHFVNFSIQNNLKIINTLFEKPNDKLATYQNPKAKLGMSKRRGTHETLDYWLTENRWQNSCVDCEADGGANINTDHYPLILEIKLQIKNRPIVSFSAFLYIIIFSLSRPFCSSCFVILLLLLLLLCQTTVLLYTLFQSIRHIIKLQESSFFVIQSINSAG